MTSNPTEVKQSIREIRRREKQAKIKELLKQAGVKIDTNEV